jgi:hypothetical protein
MQAEVAAHELVLAGTIMKQKHAVSAAQTCIVMQWNCSQFSKDLTAGDVAAGN